MLKPPLLILEPSYNTEKMYVRGLRGGPFSIRLNETLYLMGIFTTIGMQSQNIKKVSGGDWIAKGTKWSFRRKNKRVCGGTKKRLLGYRCLISQIVVEPRIAFFWKHFWVFSPIFLTLTHTHTHSLSPSPPPPSSWRTSLIFWGLVLKFTSITPGLELASLWPRWSHGGASLILLI